MYCKKCGAEISDEAVFCRSCGAATGDLPPSDGGAAGSGGHKTRNILLGALAVAAAALIVMGVFVSRAFVGGRSAEETVEQGVEAVAALDVDGVLALVPPELMQELRPSEVEALTEEISDKFENIRIYVKYRGGGSFEVECDYIRLKGYDEAELEEVKNLYEAEFGIKIQDATDTKVEYSVKYANGKVEDETGRVQLVKVGGDWYLDALAMSSALAYKD